MSKLTGDQKSDAQLIGQFGVGFTQALLLQKKLRWNHAVQVKKQPTVYAGLAVIRVILRLNRLEGFTWNRHYFALA